MREILKEHINNIPTNEFALFLSGGMDSLLLLQLLIEEKKKVTCYNFRRDDILSSDFIKAKTACEYYNIPFVEVLLNMRDREYLLWRITKLKYSYGAKKKTEFECAFPFLESSHLVKQKHILVGHAADGHYCISKKGMLHWRDKIQDFRDNYFSNPYCCQNHILRAIFSKEDKQIHFPYMDKNLIEFFRGRSWDDCNRPKQKQITRDSFKLPLPFSLDNHTNLQLGDSKIAEGFNILLEGTKFKSPVSIYNRL